MKVNDYIQVDSNAIYNNKEFKLYYDGYLTSVSNNEPVTLRYGDQNWNNLKIVKMKKDENNRLYANIKLNNFDKINFCFEYNNVWDNNFSNNYSLQVNKLNLENYVEDENLNEYLSDDFLFAYNLNKKEEKELPSLSSESEIFENASNVYLSEIELENLKEALEKIFPNEKTKKVKFEIEEKDVAHKFADSFSSSPLYDDNFIKIEYTDPNKLEYFKPEKPLRNLLIEKFGDKKDNFISNISLENETEKENDKIVLKSKVPYRPYMIELSKMNESRQILKLGNEEDSQFLVVSPYSEVDIYDNSFIGTIKRYSAYISKSLRKIFYYLKENLEKDENN